MQKLRNEIETRQELKSVQNRWYNRLNETVQITKYNVVSDKEKNEIYKSEAKKSEITLTRVVRTRKDGGEPKELEKSTKTRNKKLEMNLFQIKCYNGRHYFYYVIAIVL